MSETGAGDEHSSPRTDPNSVHDSDKPDNSDQPPRKRQRVRLSCLECRRRKLSCDRGFPCERCLKSGTPDRCTYETRPGLAPPTKTGLGLSSFDGRLSLPNGLSESLLRKDSMRDYDRIRRLELEVSTLKNLLLKQAGSDGSTLVEHSPSTMRPEVREPPTDESVLPPFLQYHDAGAEKDELRFFRGKEFKTRYFGPHNACMAFSELTGLTPFMRETAEEWLKPLHIAQNPKDRPKRKVEREKKYQEPDLELEALLPSKNDTDALVSVYLDQFEQLHRIIHIPSFRREYAQFWDPTKPRYAALTALVLSMMSISSCMHSRSSPSKFVGMVSCSHQTAEKWIKACEEWHRRQSQKHRKLIHYQISCLLYLAKRVNTVKKKRFWTNSGILAREGISLGLHRDPVHMLKANISPFYQEMRRRIWATIQEFDFQAAFDHGLPTIVSSLHFDVNPPRNLNDEDFDEDSTELPPSKPITEYTMASYQHLARQSLSLRLELSRLLTGPPEEIDYEQVIRYTDSITQEIDSLPSWDTSGDTSSEGSKKPLLAYTLLHIQLRQYIIPLHQPYLRMRKANSRYQFSEIMYYNAARDMVLLHDKLTQQGIRTLNFLREDALTLAVNLCSVTLLQPRGSTNMIMVNSQHTINLIEKCLSMKEDRILRCGNNEPWGYSIMCAAYGLLETHLGVKDSQTAKSTSAERFINLHYRLLAGQEPPISSQQSDAGAGVASRPAVPEFFERAKSATPLPPPASQGSLTQVEVPSTPLPWWLPNGSDQTPNMQPINPDFSMELLGLNLNELWADTTFDGFP